MAAAICRANTKITQRNKNIGVIPKPKKGEHHVY